MADQADLQKTIDILVQAEDRTAPGLDEAEARLRTFQAKVQKLREQDAKDAEKASKGGLLGLKGALGEESKFGLAAKTLAGAGAAAGLSFAGRELNAAVQAAVSLRNELNAGNISAGEFTEKLAGAIPIYGQIWQAGRGIRELITGEQAEVERLNREHEATNKYLESRLSLQRMSRDMSGEQVDMIRKLNAEVQALAQPEGRQRDLSQAGSAFGATGQDIQSQFAAVIQKINDERAKARGPLEAGLANAQSRANDIRGHSFEQEGDRENLAEAEAQAKQAGDRLKKIDTDADAARNVAKARLAAANQLAAEKYVREQMDVTRKANEQQDREEEAARQKEEQRLEQQKQLYDKQVKAYEDYWKKYNDTAEQAQRMKDTENSRVDSALNSFFDFEPMMNALSQVGRGRPQHYVGTAESEMGGTLGGYGAQARERASFMGSDPEAADRRDRAQREKDLIEAIKKNTETQQRAIDAMLPHVGDLPSMLN